MLKELFLNYAGLSVLECTYKDKNGHVWIINAFDYVASTAELTKEFIEHGWGHKLPFAFDSGGWHFCLSFEEDTFGKIIMNRWSLPPEDQFLIISDSLEEFINGLQERQEDEGIN